MIRDKIFKVQADIKEGKTPEGQRSIIHELIMDDVLPAEDKTLARLEAEAVALVAAGLVLSNLGVSYVVFP